MILRAQEHSIIAIFLSIMFQGLMYTPSIITQNLKNYFFCSSNSISKPMTPDTGIYIYTLGFMQDFFTRGRRSEMFDVSLLESTH